MKRRPIWQVVEIQHSTSHRLSSDLTYCRFSLVDEIEGGIHFVHGLALVATAVSQE